QKHSGRMVSRGCWLPQEGRSTLHRRFNRRHCRRRVCYPYSGRKNFEWLACDELGLTRRGDRLQGRRQGPAHFKSRPMLFWSTADLENKLLDFRTYLTTIARIPHWKGERRIRRCHDQSQISARFDGNRTVVT